MPGAAKKRAGILEWLDCAYSQLDGRMALIKYPPFLGPLLDDPRYAALVRKLGLPA